MREVNKSSTFDLLSKIKEQEKLSLDFGFYWESIEQLFEQIRSECDEVQEAWQKGDLKHLQEEIGDIINATISLAIFCKIDPFTALEKSAEKYQNRFDQVVSLTQNDKLKNLKGQSMEVLLSYWKKAKKIVG